MQLDANVFLVTIEQTQNVIHVVYTNYYLNIYYIITPPLNIKICFYFLVITITITIFMENWRNWNILKAIVLKWRFAKMSTNQQMEDDLLECSNVRCCSTCLYKIPQRCSIMVQLSEILVHRRSFTIGECHCHVENVTNNAVNEERVASSVSRFCIKCGNSWHHW